MTHSLHRIGNKENLQNDFTIIVRPERGINDKGSQVKTRAILKILKECHAVNITSARGENYKGNIYECNLDDIINGIEEGDSIYAAFDNQHNLELFLKSIIDKDYGLSVVVQGIYENVKKSLNKVGLKVHTTNHSLGIWGKTEMLPEKSILEITTMCGHGMIAPLLLKEVIKNIRKGSTTVDEGVKKLAKVCICGIFNTTRAKELIKKLV